MAQSSRSLRLVRCNSESNNPWRSASARDSQGPFGAMPSQLDMMEQVLGSTCEDDKLCAPSGLNALKSRAMAVRSGSRTPEPMRTQSVKNPSNTGLERTYSHEAGLFGGNGSSTPGRSFIPQSNPIYRIASTPPSVYRKSVSQPLTSHRSTTPTRTPRSVVPPLLTRRQKKELMARILEQEEARQGRLREIKAKVNYHQDLAVLKHHMMLTMLAETKRQELEGIQEEEQEEQKQEGKNINKKKKKKSKGKEGGSLKSKGSRNSKSKGEECPAGEEAEGGTEEGPIEGTTCSGKDSEASNEGEGSRAEEEREALLPSPSPSSGLEQKGSLPPRPARQQDNVSVGKQQETGEGVWGEGEKGSSLCRPQPGLQDGPLLLQQQQEKGEKGDGGRKEGSKKVHEGLKGDSQALQGDEARSVRRLPHSTKAPPSVPEGTSEDMSSEKGLQLHEMSRSKSDASPSVLRSFRKHLTVELPTDSPHDVLSPPAKETVTVPSSGELNMDSSSAGGTGTSESLDSCSSTKSRHERHRSAFALESPSTPQPCDVKSGSTKVLEHTNERVPKEERKPKLNHHRSSSMRLVGSLGRATSSGPLPVKGEKTLRGLKIPTRGAAAAAALREIDRHQQTPDMPLGCEDTREWEPQQVHEAKQGVTAGADVSSKPGVKTPLRRKASRKLPAKPSDIPKGEQEAGQAEQVQDATQTSAGADARGDGQSKTLGRKASGQRRLKKLEVQVDEDNSASQGPRTPKPLVQTTPKGKDPEKLLADFDGIPKGGLRKAREASQKKGSLPPRPSAELDAKVEVHLDYSVLFDKARAERRPRIIRYGALDMTQEEVDSPVKVFQVVPAEEEGNEFPVPHKSRSRAKKHTSLPKFDAAAARAAAAAKAIAAKSASVGATATASSVSQSFERRAQAPKAAAVNAMANAGSVAVAAAAAASHQASTFLFALSRSRSASTNRHTSPIPCSEPVGLQQTDSGMVNAFPAFHRRTGLIGTLHLPSASPLRVFSSSPDTTGQLHKGSQSPHISRSCFATSEVVSPKEEGEGFRDSGEEGGRGREAKKLEFLGGKLELERSEGSQHNGSASDTSDSITQGDSSGTSTP